MTMSIRETSRTIASHILEIMTLALVIAAIVGVVNPKPGRVDALSEGEAASDSATQVAVQLSADTSRDQAAERFDWSLSSVRR